MTTLKVKNDHILLTYGEQIQVTQSVSDLFSNNKTLEAAIREPLRGEMIYRMVAYILERSNPKEIIYRTPKNWWQMFKRDVMPAWFNRRFPVREWQDTVIIKDVYPFPTEKFVDPIGNVVRIAKVQTISIGEDDE